MVEKVLVLPTEDTANDFRSWKTASMSPIKAFVGHSFTAEDSEIVEKFLKFFTRLEKMNAGFSWVHAEAAEPKQLADKVMTLIQDRNLFIGICTKKELAVRPERLSKLPLLNKQYANIQDLEWKTSDWIIQEIGLAKGRNLEILLLIENGVRKPAAFRVMLSMFHLTAQRRRAPLAKSLK